jgi:hypothetical protein
MFEERFFINCEENMKEFPISTAAITSKGYNFTAIVENDSY